MYEICRDIDIDCNGYISFEELFPYIGSEGGMDNSQGSKIENSIWPEWLILENKAFLAKKIIMKLINSQEKSMMSPLSAFSIHDLENNGTIDIQSFSREISKLCPELSVDEM